MKLKTLLSALISVGLLCSLPAFAEQKPKNIIYMIGDGMSMAHLSAYRYYKNSTADHVGLGNKQVPKTLFDLHFVGVASTLPDDDTLVTDSAAGATALSSGIKTYNGAIALDNDKTETLTLIEQAKRLNKLTATISTSQVTHATPASFIAHNESRRNQNEIANDIFDKRINGKFVADLMLGGGTHYFIRDDRNLVSEFKSQGFDYIDDLEKLSDGKQLPLLGLFAPKGLPYAIDNKSLPYRLETMTKAGLALLNKDNPNGFVVMVEGSQIDWCSHGNDVACAMLEMADFERALAVAIDFAEKDGETLVVLTADHGTGGLTIGANGQYKWLPNEIHKVKASAEQMTKQIVAGENVAQVWQQSVSFDLESEQLKQLTKLQKSDDGKLIHRTIVDIISARSFTGWTTPGHTGEDVAVIAYGVGMAKFAGYQDNTDIAKTLFSLIR